MGLDLVMFEHNNKIIGIVEIDYSLHESIFQSNNNWKSYNYLKKISNYYLTDIVLERTEIKKLIEDLMNIKIFIPKNFHSSLEELVKILKNNEIEKIHIGGD